MLKMSSMGVCQTMKTSQGRIFTNHGEFNDDGDLPDGPYDREFF
jgi:hypothetical protein